MYIREKIIRNIVSTLGAISTSGGYESTVKKATRKYKAHDQVKSYPFICVIPGNSNMQHLDSNETFEGNLQFTILAYVKTTKDLKDTGLLSIVIESMVGDIIKAMYADYRRGYPADVDETVIEQVEDYYDWENEIGIAALTGHVLYRGTFTNP